MRDQTAIAKLDAQKGSVPFPKQPPFSWDEFRRALMDALAHNGLGNAWEWDDMEGTGFFRDFTQPAVVGGFYGTLSVTVTLDVNKPLGEEIERLIGVRAAFEKACQRSVNVHEAEAFAAGLKTP